MGKSGYIMDSYIYREILEFIKNEGIEPFLKCSKILKWLSSTNRYDELIDDLFLSGVDKFATIKSENKIIIDFLKRFNHSFLSHQRINSKEFASFINYIAKSIDNIDLYIKNARLLESLKFGSVYINNDFINQACNLHNILVFSNKNGLETIIKPYSDGIITYSDYNKEKSIDTISEEYKVNYDNPSWIVIAENHNNGQQYRYFYAKDFGFDSSKIPSYEELISYDEPKAFIKYKRELKKKK